jgi:hypothetical protein
MDIINNQLIHSFLIGNNEFLDSLVNEFDEDDVKEIVQYCKDLNSNYPAAMDNFYDWFESLDGSTNVLYIGWDSDSGGPGGNGFISFDFLFGLVKMTSSDFESAHIEIFDKENFFPWAIEHLKNDKIEISSDIYTSGELLKLVKDMGTNSNTRLIINGEEI